MDWRRLAVSPRSRRTTRRSGSVEAKHSTAGREPPTIAPSNVTSGAEGVTYTITISNIDATDTAGNQSSVDQVALDFRGTGMNFNTVVREDIRAIRNPGTDTAAELIVTKTRTSLTGDQPTIGISRASGQPRVTEGDTLQLRIPGLRNPTPAGQYTVRVQLNELATGLRAGVLDTRTGQFTIREDAGTVTGTITRDDEPVTTEVTLTDSQGNVLGTETPDDDGGVTLDGVSPGSYDVTAETVGAQDTTAIVEVAAGEETAIDVDLPPEETEFVVEDVSVPEMVTRGDPIEGEATITNHGTEDGTQEVTFELLQGDRRVLATETEEITLGAGESTTISPTFESDDLERGELSLRVSTENDTNAEFFIFNPEEGEITVENVAADSPVSPDENVNVTATVASESDTTQSGYVEAILDGEHVTDETTTIGPGEERTVTVDMGTLETGDHTVGVQAGDETTEVPVEVQETSPQIDAVDAVEQVPRGEPVQVAVTITNTGDVTGVETVAILVNGRTVDAKSVTAGPGETRSVVLSWPTEGVSTGTYDIGVRTSADTASASVTVTRPRR